MKRSADYIYTSRLNIYVACDFIETFWPINEFKSVVDYWNEGLSLEEISKMISRTEDEVSLLIIDLAEYTKVIQKRDRGIQQSSPVSITASNRISISRFLTSYKNGYEMYHHGKVDFIWDERVVVQFDDMWKKGLSIEHIKNPLKRPYIEICVLVIDRAAKGYITPRKNGLEGEGAHETHGSCKKTKTVRRAS